MMREKVNDYFEFPMEFNFKPWTQSGIKEKEDDSPSNLVEQPPEYYEYELTGILIHSGSANAGHYFSYIKETEGL